MSLILTFRRSTASTVTQSRRAGSLLLPDSILGFAARRVLWFVETVSVESACGRRVANERPDRTFRRRAPPNNILFLQYRRLSNGWSGRNTSTTITSASRASVRPPSTPA
jgi:hypothetical protein